jgi:ABC-type nitrate/sulfonate/bicarbonate transport system substrate-binding protein
MLVQPKVWLGGDQRSGVFPRLRLSAAHDEWNHVGFALAAIERGFLAEEGFADVELITFPGAGEELLARESLQVDLLARGLVDIAIDPRTTFLLEARDQGRPVAIVAARRRDHTFVLVGQKGLKSLDDLRGKSVCMGPRGGATDVMLRQVLKDNGLEPDEDVVFEYVGGEMHDSVRVTREFVAGRYGPAKMVGTGALPWWVENGYPILADLRTMYPSRHDRVTAANENFVQGHPQALQSFLKGLIRASRWVLDPENAVEFKQIILDAGFLDDERQRDGFDHMFAGWQLRGSRDLELPREGIDLIVDEQKRSGAIAPAFRPTDILRLDALHRAQSEIDGASPDAVPTTNRPTVP